MTRTSDFLCKCIHYPEYILLAASPQDRRGGLNAWLTQLSQPLSIIAMYSAIVEAICLTIVLPFLCCCPGGAVACAWFALVILEAAGMGVYVIYMVDRTIKADKCATAMFGDCTRGVSFATGVGVCRILMV
jgi:hypothetical protein